jgi:hypothetical protein
LLNIIIEPNVAIKTMKRVTGIGGIFFKARDAEKLRDWYRDHLGGSGG